MRFGALFYLLRIRRYFEFDGTETSFLRAAVKSTPWSYRFLGRTVNVEQLDDELGQWEEWLDVKTRMEPGDRIWPFTINPDTRALRQGYVVVRNRQPVECVVCISS